MIILVILCETTIRIIDISCFIFLQHVVFGTITGMVMTSVLLFGRGFYGVNSQPLPTYTTHCSSGTENMTAFTTLIINTTETADTLNE